MLDALQAKFAHPQRIVRLELYARTTQWNLKWAKGINFGVDTYQRLVWKLEGKRKNFQVWSGRAILASSNY